LPAALAARLAKRGIISKKSAQQQPVKNPEEEVFAESYDDQDEVNTSPQKSRNDSNPQAPSSRFGMVTNAEAMEKMKFMGYPCCPNKWNIYHECTTYCQNHWNSKRSTGPEPGSEYAVKHKAMREAIGTLPEEWQEKWDAGTGRHYYWCTRTDKVSWLPPGHPKAKITEAASHVREMIQNQIHMEPDQDDLEDDSEDDEEEDEHAMDLDSDMESDHEEEERLRRNREQRKREEKLEKRTKDRIPVSLKDRGGNSKKGRDSSSGTLDPMDPSAYSDTPRGSWKSGLEKEDGGRAIQHGPAQD